MCIDDDDDDQYLIGQAFQQLALPNPVLFFPHGEAALAYLETTQDRPFLILCDINMPLMNGLELRRWINDNDWLRQKSIPFIFLTTTASGYAIEEAYKESVQGFSQKTTSYEQLCGQLTLITAYWESCLHANSQA